MQYLPAPLPRPTSVRKTRFQPSTAISLRESLGLQRRAFRPLRDGRGLTATVLDVVHQLAFTFGDKPLNSRPVVLSMQQDQPMHAGIGERSRLDRTTGREFR